MNRHDGFRLTSWALLVGCLLAVSGVAAQDDKKGELAQEISAAQQANWERLQQWSWKSRVGVEVGNEPKLTKVFHVRFVDGQVKRTLVGGSTAKKGKKAQAKQQKAQQWLEHVAEAVRAYAMATPGQLLDFFDEASFVIGRGPTEGTLRIRGTGFLQPDDNAILWLDMKTMLINKMEFRTTVDDQVLQGLISFKKVKGGTYYPAKATVQVPSTQVNATVENTDPAREGG